MTIPSRMTPTHIADIDIGALFLMFDRALYLVTEKAAFGLDRGARLESAPDRLMIAAPGGIFLRLEARPVEEVRDDFASWILKNTFRDWIEEVTELLLATRRLAVVFTRGGMVLPIEEFTELTEGTGAKRFERLAFPDKLDELRKQFGIVGAHDESVRTINNVRNCLVHRRGRVTEKDCNRPGEMIVHWLRASLTVASANGGVSRFEPPHQLAPGDDVRLGILPGERSFALGASIEITRDDLLCLWWTLRAFAWSLVQSVEAFAIRQGFHREAPSPEDPRSTLGTMPGAGGCETHDGWMRPRCSAWSKR